MKKTQSMKLLSLILCFVLVAAIALTTTGCGTATATVTATAAPATEAPAATEAPVATEEPVAEEPAAGTDVYTEDTELGEGSKTITFAVTDREAKLITFTIHTDAETVGNALLGVNLIAGEESAYGLYVKEVNGVIADYDVDQTYWAFYINGEYAMTGVDATALEDGAVYAFTVEGLAPVEEAPFATDCYEADTELGEGSKTITFIVTDKDANAITFTIHTDAETVGEALLGVNLIAGEDSSYGLYVKVVNGITADYDVDQTYWAFYINGEYAMTGVDATALEDGATYGFTVEG